MITVFGSINIDFVTEVPRLAGPGETVIGAAYMCVPGGKGGNQALAARRAGADVKMVGAVGEDAFAEAALVHLRDAGVDLAAVATSDLPTGAAFISVDADGRNTITVAAGANTCADGSVVGRLGLGAGDTLILQREVPDEQGKRAASAAKAAGSRVVLNLAPSGAIPDHYLALVDLLIMNEHEAADLAAALAIGTDEPEPQAGLAEFLQRRFATDVVVTLGSRGAAGWSGGVEHRAYAPSVAVVDTTGAGDTFVGAFATALTEGAGFADALRFGTVAGSLACTRHGAQAGIPTRQEIDAAMAGMSVP